MPTNVRHQCPARNGYFCVDEYLVCHLVVLVRIAYTPLAFVKVMTISLKKGCGVGLCPVYMKTLPEVMVEKATAVIEVCQQYD